MVAFASDTFLISIWCVYAGGPPQKTNHRFPGTPKSGSAFDIFLCWIFILKPLLDSFGGGRAAGAGAPATTTTVVVAGNSRAERAAGCLAVLAVASSQASPPQKGGPVFDLTLLLRRTCYEREDKAISILLNENFRYIILV